ALPISEQSCEQRCDEWSPQRSTIANGVPSKKNDFETLRFCAFAAPGSRLAQHRSLNQLRNPGLSQIPQLEGQTKIEAQAFRSEVNGLCRQGKLRPAVR